MSKRCMRREPLSRLGRLSRLRSMSSQTGRGYNQRQRSSGSIVMINWPLDWASRRSRYLVGIVMRPFVSKFSVLTPRNNDIPPYRHSFHYNPLCSTFIHYREENSSLSSKVSEELSTSL